MSPNVWNIYGKTPFTSIIAMWNSTGSPLAEARGAESQRDFIHKLKLGLKELNESQIWLKMIKRSGIIENHKSNAILSESIELSRIFNASIKTARAKLENSK